MEWIWTKNKIEQNKKEKGEWSEISVWDRHSEMSRGGYDDASYLPH
jgi:hypothetical protein